jgi:hypothetical protein
MKTGITHEDLTGVVFYINPLTDSAEAILQLRRVRGTRAGGKGLPSGLQSDSLVAFLSKFGRLRLAESKLKKIIVLWV